MREKKNKGRTMQESKFLLLKLSIKECLLHCFLVKFCNPSLRFSSRFVVRKINDHYCDIP